MGDSLATRVLASPPETFADFKDVLCNHLPEEITKIVGPSQHALPTELVKDITEKEVELIRRTFDFSSEQQIYGLLIMELCLFNVHFTADAHTQGIQWELKKLGKKGLSVPVLLFLGLIAFSSQYTRQRWNDQLAEASKNLEEGKVWAEGIRQAIDNLHQVHFNGVPDLNGGLHAAATVSQFPGDTLKLSVCEKMHQLGLKEPLSELRRHVDASLQELQCQHAHTSNTIKEHWPLRATVHVPAVRQAFLEARELFATAWNTRNGINKAAIRYFDLWGFDISLDKAKQWPKKRGKCA